MKIKTISAILVIILGWNFCTAQVLETVKLPEVQKTGGMSLMEALQNRQSRRS